MENPLFVHLQVHSEYSVVEGMLSIDTIIEKAKESGATAVGITDTHNIFAMVKLYQKAIKAKIKPFIATKARIWEKTSSNEAITYELLLYCKNLQGYRNLCFLLTKSYQEGQKQGIAYIDRDWLCVERCEGLLAIEPGIDGFSARTNIDQVEQVEAWMHLFPDSYYFGLHRIGREGERDWQRQLRALSRQKALPIVALNAACFAEEADYEAHEVRVAIQESQVVSARADSPYSRKQYWRSNTQMQACFADIPEAIENTYIISKRLNVRLDLGRVCLPDFPVDKGKSLIAHLAEMSQEKLASRLKVELESIRFDNAQLDLVLAGEMGEDVKKRAAIKDAVTLQNYQARLQIELSIIEKMGFPGYFLIVADFIQWAKDHRIPVGPGRGSGAGSLVAYALGITDIDPLPHGLLFERFLNPERVSMPDFDIDFCMIGRDKVIEYVGRRYGQQCVAQIITYGTMAAKAAIRDVGRAMALPYGLVDKIAKMVPNDLGITLEKALLQAPDLADRYDRDTEVKALIDMALKLEGCVRNVGRHAGGVVIAPGQLIDFCPLYQEMNSTHQVTQYDMGDIEKAGLVKFDFLGLRTLTIIAHAVRSIIKAGVEDSLDISQIPLDDEKTFQLLKTGHTTAVFQLESRGFQELICRLRPDVFADIVALVALYRPGPLQTGMVDDFIDRKHGRQKVRYLHPCMEKILNETYGVIVYQEQVMQIAQSMAKYTLGGADLLRRAMGKKKPEEMAKQRKIFIKGSTQNAVDEDLAGEVFDLMEKFAGYGFNKSHSVAYAMIAYQTAFLKAHYIDYFMAAVLTSDMDNTDKVVHYCKDCEARGLTILPPSIQQSQAIFVVEKPKQIRFALGAIKGVGEGIAEQLVRCREGKGVFTDMLSLCVRMEDTKLNRKVLEALIFSGAMDALGPSRSVLLASIETILAQKDQYCRNQQIGQGDLFGGAQGGVPACQYANPLPGWRTQEKLAAEKEVLGRYFSGHPLDPYRKELGQLGLSPIINLAPKQKKTVRIAGLVTKQRRMTTKQGRLFMLIEIMDLSGALEVACFDDKMMQAQLAIQDHSVVVLTGQVQAGRNSQEVRFGLNQIRSLAQVRLEKAPKIKIHIEKKSSRPDIAQAIKDILSVKKGRSRIMICYKADGSQVVLHVEKDLSVDVDEALLKDLTDIKGIEEVELAY